MQLSRALPSLETAKCAYQPWLSLSRKQRHIQVQKLVSTATHAHLVHVSKTTSKYHECRAAKTHARSQPRLRFLPAVGSGPCRCRCCPDLQAVPAPGARIAPPLLPPARCCSADCCAAPAPSGSSRGSSTSGGSTGSASLSPATTFSSNSMARSQPNRIMLPTWAGKGRQGSW